MSRVALGRRRFLVGALRFAAVVFVAPASIALVVDRALLELSEEDALRSLVRHPAAAARLGRAYLRLHPDEATPARLVRHLLGELASVSPEIAGRRIAQGIAADFDAGRVTRVQGWILSRTEARLFALVALSPEAA
jgi:hypothetical protein